MKRVKFESQRVALAVGETLEVYGPDNGATTGFQWNLVGRDPDDAVLRFHARRLVTTFEDEPDACGTPLEIAFVFEARAPGATKVELIYNRPWLVKAGDKPAVTIEVVVT